MPKPQQETEGGWLLSGPKRVSLCLGRYRSLCIFSSKNLSQQAGSNQHSLADISCWEKELQSCLWDGFPQAPPTATSPPSEFWARWLTLFQLASIWLHFGSAVLPAMTKTPCFTCWFFLYCSVLVFFRAVCTPAYEPYADPCWLPELWFGILHLASVFFLFVFLNNCILWYILFYSSRISKVNNSGRQEKLLDFIVTEAGHGGDVLRVGLDYLSCLF